ncbi:MAG: FtsB family cell division protein [Desulfuromonadales bacterium]
MSDKTRQPADPTARRIPWWPCGVVAVMFVFALFGDRGILHIFKLKRQQGDLQQQLTQVEEANTGLRKEIASLSADRRHLERLARSQLGMVREDEVVYQFASKTRPAPPVPPAAIPTSSR